MIYTGLTVEDLEAMPDDGRRYELIGGAIVLTPAPEVGHQRASRRLQSLLEASWPAMEVFNAPIDLDLPSGDVSSPTWWWWNGAVPASAWSFQWRSSSRSSRPVRPSTTA